MKIAKTLTLIGVATLAALVTQCFADDINPAPTIDTAAEYYAYCYKTPFTIKHPSTASADDLHARQMCLVFTRGLLVALQSSAHTYPQGLIPAHLTTEQTVEITLEFISRHPEIRSRDSFFTMTAALTAAWAARR
jgi:hypothetical protein